MKRALNILKWFAIGIAVILIVLTGLSFFLQDKIVTVFLASVNKTISTKIESGKASFSLIARFPKASVRLENVLIHPSSGFDRSQYKKSNIDTLLFARSVVCEFKVTDILNSLYNIENISVSSGSLNLFTDSTGKINYDISFGKSSPSGKAVVIDLEKINLSNIVVSFFNSATRLNISGLIKNGRIKSRIEGNTIDVTASSSMQLARVEIFPVFLRTGAAASLDLNLHKSDSGIIFRKGILKVDNFNFTIAGIISDNNNVNLKIAGRNIDVSKIKKFLSPSHAKKLLEYDPAGMLKIDAGITGIADRTHNPQVKLTFSLEKGRVLYRRSNLRLDKISFAGSFTNGKLRRPETSILLLSKAEATLGSAHYSGTIKVENFVKPGINLSLSGNVIPSELSDFFNIKVISWAKGSADINLKLSGILKINHKYTLADLLKLRPTADITFRSMGIGIDSDKVVLKDIKGKMHIARSVTTDSLSFSYKNQQFLIDGEFTNLPAWLADQHVQLKAIGDLSIKNFNPGLFMQDSSSSGSKKSEFKLPGDVELNINLDIRNMEYHKFTARRIKGRLLYKAGLISLNSFNINSFGGNIEGDCFLAKGERGSYISHGNFTFYDIDINKAFSSFNNFGQDFIKAENIAGTLSGRLSLLIPFDPKFNPVSGSVNAEGKYTITDGALTNFEPARSLSGFIEITELENITFSKLENDFYIKNRYVVVPQMDIHSSAADFVISGKHGFDNDYEYHVRTYLSVILSKKVKKPKKSSTEFGAVEDDGLGRTSVFLKVTGKDEDIKVGYDIKAAGGKIRQNVKTEKESLKSILNKEYGWYKKDSIITRESAARPKYRIEWDESDTTETRTDTVATNKSKGINSIFNRKKGS